MGYPWLFVTKKTNNNNSNETSKCVSAHDPLVVPAVESVGMSTRTDLEGNEAADSSEQLVTGAALGRIAMNPHATKAAGLQNLSPEERKARLVKFAASARPTAQGQEHIRWRRGAWRSSSSSTRPTFSYGRGWWKSLDGSLPS